MPRDRVFTGSTRLNFVVIEMGRVCVSVRIEIWGWPKKGQNTRKESSTRAQLEGAFPVALLFGSDEAEERERSVAHKNRSSGPLEKPGRNDWWQHTFASDIRAHGWRQGACPRGGVPQGGEC